jgi:acyl-coenzyme A thioesterase PaaI-like protein
MALKEFHENCFACGKNVKNGLNLKFKLLEDNTLCGEFKIHKSYQGYDNILHGGIISTILDCSMINLFYMKKGIELKTVKLKILFRQPIPVGEVIIVKALMGKPIRHFYKAKSQIILGNKVFAEAEGYFRK